MTGFGVAVALVAMTGSLELGTNVGVVEDFAVVGDPQRVVLVGHGLAAGGEVDDAEAAVAQGNFTLHVETGAVGPTMRDDIGHRPDDARVGGTPSVFRKPAMPHMTFSTARRPRARGSAPGAALRRRLGALAARSMARCFCAMKPKASGKAGQNWHVGVVSQAVKKGHRQKDDKGGAQRERQLHASSATLHSDIGFRTIEFSTLEDAEKEGHVDDKPGHSHFARQLGCRCYVSRATTTRSPRACAISFCTTMKLPGPTPSSGCFAVMMRLSISSVFARFGRFNRAHTQLLGMTEVDTHCRCRNRWYSGEERPLASESRPPGKRPATRPVACSWLPFWPARE